MDISDIQRLATHLIKHARHLQAVPISTMQQALAKQRKRAYRKCTGARCQRKLGPKLFSATHGLRLEIKRAGRRCTVKAQLYAYPRRKPTKQAAHRAKCHDGALAASTVAALCEAIAALGQVDPARCQQEGELFWLDRMTDQLLASQPNLTDAKTGERILALKVAYLAAAKRNGSPRLKVAAHCGAGRLYEGLATVMAASPSFAKSYKKGALALYRACAARARASKVPIPKEAREALGIRQ